MKSNLRLVFMGTPDFAVHILSSIHQAGYNIVGVISVPDKPAGRGQKLHESAVTRYAKENSLNLMQPEKLKSKAFLDEFRALKADLAVVVAFRMLPKEVWEIPTLGTFNLHASLLPEYRGAAPINWAIINGEKETGVTTFFIDEKIDTGEILLQENVDILPEDTAGDLHDKLMKIGADLVLKTIDGIEKKQIIPRKQTETKPLKAAPKIFKEDTEIHWDDRLENIQNLIRGMSPYPTAWTHISTQNQSKVLKIFQSHIEYREHSHTPKSVFKENQSLGIAHPEGIIWLDEVQIQGKRRMHAKDFMNGYVLDETTKVGGKVEN